MKKTQKNFEKIVSQFCWNVWIEDFNTKEIKEWNVFNHGRYCADIIKALLQCQTKEEFADKLKSSTMYFYWSKCEWEIVLTSWPPYINKEELDRLNREFEEYNAKWGRYPCLQNVILTVGEKIDVYNQLQLNWGQFVSYIWNSVSEGLNK